MGRGKGHLRTCNLEAGAKFPGCVCFVSFCFFSASFSPPQGPKATMAWAVDGHYWGSRSAESGVHGCSGSLDWHRNTVISAQLHRWWPLPQHCY